MTILKRLPLLFVLFSVSQSCQDDETPARQKPIKAEFNDYATIKSDDWESNIGNEITVEGYLVPVANNTYKIVNDSLYAQVNTILPDENYILVQADPNGSDLNTLHEFSGARIKATGTLKTYQPRDVYGESIMATKNLLGSKALATIELQELPLHLGGRHYKQANGDVSKRLNLHINPLPKKTTKFALLYSGGIDAMGAYSHYYNNIRVMYNLLLTQGYEAENIVVVYKDGSAESIVPTTVPPYFKTYEYIPVNEAATPTGFNNAIALLNDKMQGKNAELFLMTTNHGGGYHAVEMKSYGAIKDYDKDEPSSDKQKVDEISSYYNTPNYITDDEFAARINSLPFTSLKALFLQCFSGGFIHDFKGPNRVLMSATTETEFSWGGGDLDLDHFLFNFITPFYSTTGSGNIFDLNTDGKLSLYEVFTGARKFKEINNKNYPKYFASPQYDDNGDGIPNEPSATGLGAEVSL